MTGEEIAERLREEGGCVIPSVIPGREIENVRRLVCELVEIQRREREETLAAARAAGHDVGISGVGCCQDVVSARPEIAAWLADLRVVGAARAVFGPHVRISATSGLVNEPGNRRGDWHADWPFNQRIAAHVPAPYPDACLHLSSIVMLTEFSAETGATLIVPRSHRWPSNPSADIGVDRALPHPHERAVTGSPGSVFLYDSRLWHCAGSNRSTAPRVAITCRYAPWWLNLNVRRRGSAEHAAMVVEDRGRDNSLPLLTSATFRALPEAAKPLFRHWVEAA